MAEHRTIFGRIQNKVTKRFTRSPSSSQALGAASNPRPTLNIEPTSDVHLPPHPNLPSIPPDGLSPPNPLSVSILPSAPDSIPSPNPLPVVNLQINANLPDQRAASHSRSSIMGEYIAEATSFVNPNTVNIVGQDQFNISAHIHMSRDISAEENAGRIEHNTEDILSNALFNKLSHVAKASYDASTPALRRACTEMTRSAILKSIGMWAIDVTKPKIYWMNGMAGTGKTTITYSLCIILKSQSILGASFFCSRLVDECTKVDRIFPTIAYNLARNYPPLAPTILKALKNDPDVANRTIKQQFADLVVKPIRESAAELVGRPIVIVIDGLDECANQTDVRTLLSVIFQHSSELPLKIFITSRPEQVVRVGFNRQNPGDYSKLILHDIERDIVNADIKFYLLERLVEMVEGRSDFQDSEDWPPEDKVDALVRQSNKLFIYAKTICDYIDGGNILERLHSATSESEEPTSDTIDTTELDRLYRYILDHAVPTVPKERVRLKQILSAIVSIRNPLSAVGLGILLEIDPRTVKSSLASLHAVISVPPSLNSPVSTFHASFPDCLKDSNRSHHHFLPSSESHLLLAKNCLSLMNSSLKENICNLTGRPANDTVTNKTIAKHISEGLSYTCVYWASHLTSARKEDLRNAGDVRELLENFLRDHVLHWMECLSLLKQLNVAIESLRMIEGWALDIYPTMSAMITDALRFAAENFDVICHYCLETYHSALVWLPVQSIIRKNYATHLTSLPKIPIGLRNAWGPCEKIIISGSIVYSVAFSSDGNHIVSGSDDNMVRIWNAVTGGLEGVLIGHSHPVRSAAFSSDGSRIVSGSVDKTVRIWNAMTGESERILKGHLHVVSSVSFSSDGIHVVSGSNDETIRMWNVVTGKSKRILKGHSGSVSSVAFSSDGSRVVSGSYDCTVRIWNVVTGKSVCVLRGRSGSVTSVAFSSDGSRVVSGLYDKTLHIWNIATSELEVTMKGHPDSVSSVAFSPDGRRVVSGSGDRMRIWTAATGELEKDIKGNSGSVLSVAFSGDGNRIVSGSNDCTVRIWNAMGSESECVLEGHSDSVTSVTFLNDGSHVMSGSRRMIRIWNTVTCELESVLMGHLRYEPSVAFSRDGCRVVSRSGPMGDKTIRVWNVVTGKLESVLEGHSEEMSCVAFSGDSRRVVSGSYDKTIRIWNAVTGELERVLDGHSNSVSSVAFSNDGSRVVSGSSDGTVRIWNTVTGELERVLEGHSNFVSSVAFSSDGGRIVSGSDDITIRIWNTMTGKSDRVLEGHSRSVFSVAFSRDGSHILSASGDGTVRTYDIATGESKCLPFSGESKASIAASDDHAFHPRVSCYLSDDQTWIRTESGQRDCWIPQRYRGFTCNHSYGSKASFGFRSGSVVVVDLIGT